MQDKEQVRQRNLAMIESWQQSGLSQKQFCLQNNIAYHIFHYWYRRYRLKQTVGTGDAGDFIPLTINGSICAACIELQLPNGKRILFHQPVSAEYLKVLLS